MLFLYSPKVASALLNKEKYESDLRRCNKILSDKKIPLKNKTDYLIERGNLLLRLIPTRDSYEDQLNVLNRAKESYTLANKFVKQLKKGEDLRRAIGQIEKKQKEIDDYEHTIRLADSVHLDDIDNFLSSLSSLKGLLTISVTFLISTLFFLSMNMTGAVTGATKQDFSLLGILFFIGGLVFAFWYAHKKVHQKVI